MGYHDKDVQFTEESLVAFIKSIHENIRDNYHFVSTNDMKTKQLNDFTDAEIEIANTFPTTWSIDHLSKICIINNEIEKDLQHLDNGRYTWVHGGSSLSFATEVLNVNAQTRPIGTIWIDENNGVTHVIGVKGFDNGNFDNSTQWTVGSGQLSPSTITTDKIIVKQISTGSNLNFDKPLIITDDADAIRIYTDGGTTINDPAAGIPDAENNDPTKLQLTGSITTKGGIAAAKTIKGQRVYAAVFNDYAECRKTINLSPGHVVIDNDDGSLSCSSARLQPGAQVISDTYGNIMGETPFCRTPIAVAGRVLVYPYQDRENYHAGMAVCSAPNGTVDIMTREEIRDYPDCIVGIVSEIPQYEKWGTDQVEVNGRIWIKVK